MRRRRAWSDPHAAVVWLLPTCLWIGLGLGLGLGLAGCQEMDPYRNPYLFQLSGANQGNLGAMLANPGDLVRGQGAEGADSGEAEAAIQRLRSGKPRPLQLTGSGSGAGYASGSGTGN